MRNIINTTHTMALTGLFALSLSACDSDDGGDGDAGAAIDIAGSYADDFGTNHTINDDGWTQSSEGAADSSFAFVEIDNAGQFAIAQNGADNGFAPSMYSKFEWTFDEAGDLYYCQPAFDAMTAEDASAASADTGDLAAGCGGFGWSKLTAS